MPELPEVETVKIGLAELLPGRVIVGQIHDWPKGFPNRSDHVEQYLIGAAVSDVRRRAKALIVDLNTNYSLVIHLKMTGQLVFRGEEYFGAGHPSRSLVAKLPDSSTRVMLTFADGSTLFFNDQRKFGWMKLIATDQVSSLPFMQKVGPEPLEKTFTNTIFIQRVRRRPRSTIKAVLLDQSVLAGVGNIYADESLWGAKIHPAERVIDISDARLKKLYTVLIGVLRLSIQKGGSTDRNYVDARGKRGSYLQFARVFRREGLECPRCNTKIIKTRVAGRGTHICPCCQHIKA